MDPYFHTEPDTVNENDSVAVVRQSMITRRGKLRKRSENME